MTTVPRIALQIDTATGYSSALIHGIVEHTREHRRWELLVQTRGSRERWRIPAHWRPDGVIARVTRRSQARELVRLGVPVVNVSRSAVPGFPFPQVTVDERAIGTWAADHLVERGFTHVAYVGLTSQAFYTDTCGPAFRERLARRGLGMIPFRAFSRGGRAREEASHAELERWVRTLPDRVGVFVAVIEDAYALSEACRASRRPVPESVAILCGEDDPLLATIASPALSCIDPDAGLVGAVAAARLEGLLRGRGPAAGRSRPELVAPLRIIQRRSTDTVACADQDVVAALRFIRDRAHTPLDVGDVLRHVPISRRALEQRFRRLLGRTPAAEIRRLRLERARELLRGTDWPMPRIAAAAGFSGAEVMNQVFRRDLGRTPSAERRRARSGAARAGGA